MGFREVGLAKVNKSLRANVKIRASLKQNIDACLLNRRRTSIVTIGIQTIMPTTATPQQKPPQPANDDIPMAARQAPPPPGMGKLVDKTI